MKRSIIHRTLMLGLLVAAGACGESADTASMLAEVGPQPGTLVVAVSSPFDNDGAYSFKLRGEGITNVRAAVDGSEVFTRETGNVVNVAVLGAALSGGVMTFDVPDVRDPSAYTATLIEVADEANDVRRDISGHGVGVSVVR